MTIDQPPDPSHPDSPARRIEELEQQLAECRRHEMQLREEYTLLELAVRGSSDGLWHWNIVTNDVYLSPQWKAMLGYEDRELANSFDTFTALLHPEDREYVLGAVQDHVEGRTPVLRVEFRMRHKDGSYRWIFDRAITLRDEQGAPLRMGGAHSDITDRKIVEEALTNNRVQAEIIRMQEATLAQLSTPLIPISNEIVVMPLIGAIDSFRAQRVIQSLLEGIAAQRAGTAIIDITGVTVVDTQVANALIQAAQAAQLLGTRVMLTGIRPEVAQTLVGLGVSLTNIVTHSTLQSGIAFALQQRRA